MCSICTVEGLPSECSVSFYPSSVCVAEMSVLRALDPVQSWLGQELEKCGIDAMIYTRYILSLLLHDNYDYDLQEQLTTIRQQAYNKVYAAIFVLISPVKVEENDIFLGFEKGACKKWAKTKKKPSDLTLEEMKKQAAVQCLRSASDENSGFESLVEELCTKLKDLQSKEDEKIGKRLDGSLSPVISPSAKNQVEMYYEAFPPLSEKPICLQEIMTVWNKSKICSYSSSSSSSTAPQTSTDTPSPKDCNSESETTKVTINEASIPVHEKSQHRKSRSEKENKIANGTVEEKAAFCKKQVGYNLEGKARPRSWSSGSSEAGSSSSGNQSKSSKCVKIKHKTRDVRNKKGRNGQSRFSEKVEEKLESKIGAGSSSSSSGGFVKQLSKRGKRPLKEIGKKDAGNEENNRLENKKDKEFREEPLWYTEPITEYFVPPTRKSKLETLYRNRQNIWDITSEAVEELSESVHSLCIGNCNIHKTYLAAGTFIDGHYVEMPADIDEASNLIGTSNCPVSEDAYLDAIHPSELTHFYEVDIDQSILDLGASDKMQGESRILNMIRQKSNENNFEAECCLVLDRLELQGESAIWTDSTSSIGGEGMLLHDLSSLAQFWDCCSSSSSGDADGESFGGESPIRSSPISDSALLDTHILAGDQEFFSDVNELSSFNSCFSVFEVQCSNSVLPFPFDALSLRNENTDLSCSANMLGKTQSRLLIWTKNSAFEENEPCSNLSTRTCSPWSHSEETRSDNETLNIQLDDSTQFSAEDISFIAPIGSSGYLEDEILDFLHDENCIQANGAIGEVPALAFKKKSKLESVCGIQLEENAESKVFVSDEVGIETNQLEDGYSSGVFNDIWTSMSGRSPVAILEAESIEETLFSSDLTDCCCCLDAETKVETLLEPNKAVQRSEYHLWEGQKENLEKRTFVSSDLSKLDCGDYTMPSKPWDINQDKENSFILGGVYGELKTFNSDGEWALVPPSQTEGSLLQCAAPDVVTVAGTDVFMTPGNGVPSGHRQLWRPFVSFEQNEQSKHVENGLNRGFSFIFHEDFLEAHGNFQVEEPGLEYSFSSFELNNPFSQVLHVECSFEPEAIASLSPSFKPKSILCSDSDSDVFHPRICGVDRTQYRAIRISPRTHFRPISTSDLSPGGGSESEFESEKDDSNIPALSHGDVFEDPQADLKPLEEDAENESHYYGKLELESGKFLPRMKKSGMEKSAQTSLEGQEESGILPMKKQQCLDCSLNKSLEIKDEYSTTICKILEPCSEVNGLGYEAACHFCAYPENAVTATELEEFPTVNVAVEGVSASQQKQCWWEKALYSPLFSGSDFDGLTKTKCRNDVKCHQDEDISKNIKQNRASSIGEAQYKEESIGGEKTVIFQRQIYSSESSGSDGIALEDLIGWADPCEDLFSRTHL